MINETCNPLSRIQLSPARIIFTVRFTVICIRYPEIAFSIYRPLSKTRDAVVREIIRDHSVSIADGRYPCAFPFLSAKHLARLP